MKVFVAALATETNTFSPMPTDKRAFEESFYAPAGRHPQEPSFFSGPLAAARRQAKAGNWQVVEGLHTFAMPAGRTVRKVYEGFRDQILAELREAMPVDMVVLGLHGAMAAEGYDDCEGDLIGRVRAIVGPKVPIGAELDPHCHLTEAMTSEADALVCFKEYPHTDFLERGEELVAIIADAALGKAKPVMSSFDCRMVQFLRTTAEPMRSFVDHIKSLEGKNGVLSVSVAHCFSYGDVADIGTKVLVITDDRKDYGDRLAEELGMQLFAMRECLAPPLLSIEASLDRAVSLPGRPVVIAEPADNAGGGAPGDSTFFLAAMLARDLQEAAFGPIWDPIAVKLSFAAGEGAVFDLRFGGKMGPTSGDPIDARVTVLKLARNAHQSFGDTTFALGDSAGLRIGGVEIVLITERCQGLGLDLFTNVGIDPTAKKIVVVKSTNHFHAAFGPMASEVLYSDGPGALAGDFRRIPYTRMKRPKWPFDADPFAAAPDQKTKSNKPKAKAPKAKQ
ncbi:MAG: M81 family metallopeptidase [Proteobacteria bacterium]|nr:M81 family metallopeptidase [Pseudomonadota bacterium]MBI3498035.1 M81 family metallopeptidase [Pseudomonadota bacterium]